MGNLLKVRQSSFFRIKSIRSCSGLLKKLLSLSGRTNTGHLSLFHRGGALKKRYRLVDFNRLIWNLGAMVVYNEYDPNRTSFLSLICYFNGMLSYVLTIEGILEGFYIYTGISVSSIRHGNRLPLMNVSDGSLINSLEIRPGLGGKLVRAAGTFAILLKKFSISKSVLIRLPSKEEILLDSRCFCTLGQVSHSDHKMEGFYKAGQRRNKGFRPVTRGVAKNPVDHPHGGGGGRLLVTPWAKVAKTVSTRKKVFFRRFMVISKSRKLRKKR